MTSSLNARFNRFVFTLWFGFFSLLLGINQLANATTESFDSAAITAIDVNIAPDYLEQFGFAIPVPQLISRVAHNLVQSQLPVVTDTKTPSSHRLDITLGQLKNAATPVGFSFYSGNADPRAPNFQKADVIPINCRLSAKANPKQMIELAMTFNANDLINNLHNGATQAKIVDTLIDDMSTACFNLLDDMTWTPAVHTNAVQPERLKPTWLPQVHVETVSKPALPAITTNNTPVAPEINDTEPRKQMIIHNQGTPLILKFGHERQ